MIGTVLRQSQICVLLGSTFEDGFARAEGHHSSTLWTVDRLAGCWDSESSGHLRTKEVANVE
jgi:hypothetical protein